MTQGIASTVQPAHRPRLGVDIGGTFTDAALEIGPQRFTAKVLTTHGAPDAGVIEVSELVLAQAGVAFSDLDVLIHGTTLATNALIERKGAKTAMLTTAGVRDVLHIGPEHRFDLYDLFIDLPPPLIPRSLRLPINERLGGDGSVLLPLSEDDVRASAVALKAEGIESVAICFLHSYANGAHERRARDILRQELPDVAISLSCEVAPEMREYERFNTACSNAYVQPKIATYLQRLQQRLHGQGLTCPILMMLSGGGLTTVDTASEFPVRLMESGPAGGAVFAASIATENGLGDVVSFDMGGTTAKICMIDGGRPKTARTFEVARVYRFKKGSGMPIRIPVIDMVEIGAGGGSIAHVNSLRHVQVGPESAGSEPGPTCYGRGGSRPAVTDADFVLGRIHPLGFAAGKFRLDREAAGAAIDTHIGQPLGLDTLQAAAAIADVVEENMSSAARVHAIEGGKVIAERTLIAFGGAAPLHAASVVRKLGMRRFLVPRAAGVGSAVGFLRAPVAYEIARSRQQKLSRIQIDDINAMLEEMADSARAVVEPAANGAPLTETRTVSMRYQGQGHELEVDIPARRLGEGDHATLHEAFEQRYEAVYGRKVGNAEAEVLTWSVLVSAPSPALANDVESGAAYSAKAANSRPVFDTLAFKAIDHAIHWRDDLHTGAVIEGPAIVEEEETSTLIPSGMTARVLPSGALLCEEAGVLPARPALGATQEEKLHA
ncbi:hydantoinase/oxoprolinase family protein [Hydrogenophaga sp.]|uniref:hydantoinase/oxoprolinase family protein n=1 Tax=Hydrogenophaga sp. TaxID=1904254 RepID=UPI00271FBC5F|nr:hydantoinase/oxoprolinase family protein [Hydrogenophaga sp.]MDO9437054.1 hydantoinase/oxoprolinase family protein [Hydrogenophaga sp.]